MWYFKQPYRQTLAPMLTGLASALLFGAATPAGKALLSGIDEQVLAGLLYLGAALGVLPFVLTRNPVRPPWRAGGRTLRLLAGAVVLGGIAGPLLLLFGLRAASAGSVSLWLNLELAATVVLGHFVFREQLTPRGWAAAAATLAAAVVLAGGEGGAGTAAAVLVGLACICWGVDNHLTALIDGIPPAQTTLWKGLAAGSFNLVLGLALQGRTGGAGMILAALLVGALSYGASVTLYVAAAQRLGAVRSQMLFSTAPFFGLLLSVLFLGEDFTLYQALSALIIAAALALMFSERHAHLHRHDPLFHLHPHRHDDPHHDHGHKGPPTAGDHAHWHRHDALEHAHRHWPDMHHRHEHPKGGENGGSEGEGGL